MAFSCTLPCGKYQCWNVSFTVIALFAAGSVITVFLHEKPMLQAETVEMTAEINEFVEDAKRQYATEPQRATEFISSLNKTWLTWKSPKTRQMYRACVPRPKEDVMPKVITGDHVLRDRADNMTIEPCINICVQLFFTYAALTRGNECYCTDVTATSNFLDYVDSSLCDVPCTGDQQHNCGGTNFMSVYRTAVPDPRCADRKMGEPGSFPLIALVSFPRSGNTWTRQLIEKATGIYTGSVYWKGERSLQTSKQEFLGGNVDYKQNNTICVKSHFFGIHHVREFEGAILLIRNPYRAMVAEVFRQKRSVFNSAPAEAIRFFKSKAWDNFVNQKNGHWKDTYLQWIKNRERCLPIIYEELERDTVAQLSHMVAFLNHGEVDRDRVVCATQEHPSSRATGVSLGNYGVETRIYLTTDPFTPGMRQKIDQTIRVVNSTLIRTHKKELPSAYLETGVVF